MPWASAAAFMCVMFDICPVAVDPQECAEKMTGALPVAALSGT